MYRILFFFVALLIPVIFGWWLFLPIAVVYVYLAKIPYEIALAGLILDLVYYFGEGLLLKYPLTLFSALLIVLAIFLSSRLEWRKTI